METPYTSVVETVYDPAEDSFLLIDALEKELSSIQALNPVICLEVGCGSGVVICALGKYLPSCVLLATDVNPIAARIARRTADRHLSESKGKHRSLETVVADIDSCFFYRLSGQLDLLLCNPPYVPTTEEEALPDDATKLAWAGGPKGTNLIDRLLPKAAQLLSDNGRLYLLLVKENNPELVCTRANYLGLEGRKVIERRCRNEHLFVYCFERKQDL
ncbi:hemK methyltransferase family member 2-like [Varroa jacobsoni]|uniref:Methyltransferase HEMK2 n=1 Tax=Varroa destructor TaxID=109461 RepID=A0A7M7JBW7_VARDE|nr:hemK methyltransferase family member 2-like [Varroa destructor]XP_022649334.1 hemK methyltransferase family member 2-like [Varroa destructor]XP_022649335.1 hemK methyltransferase family member 2-like [Varroa destructor]XP_022696599.1 hemK methyltransferase family member 2-like [Varroa jacobsoni]